jgi:hypothetical protein
MIETMKQAVRTGQCKKIFGRAGWMFALILFLMAAGSASAQLTSADIVGTVTDSSGAVIANANVTVQNMDTHEQRTAQSNQSGEYQFSLLPVGRYTVTVKMKGFKSSSTSNLAIEAGDRARADVKLAVGGETDTVTVEAQTPLLQADNATVSSTVTAKAVQDLPLNGRNFVQLVQLVPGANEGPGNGLTSGGRPDDRRNTSGFSVNGQDDTLNNYVIDGIDDNERVIGSIGVKPNVEGIQEITVQTNSYAAEAGRTAGGVVNIVTRSGTNKFHGTAYEFFRNDIFDARNVQQTTGRKPELRQNQFGGSIGGPIFKDRTFFFFDYEGFRQVAGLTYTSTVPTLSEYNSINSIGGSSPADLIAASTGGVATYCAGNAGCINPIALAYLKLFPAPNVAGASFSNNYIVSPSKTQTSNTYDARIDHRFNDKNLFFAGFSANKVDTVTPQALGTTNGIQVSGGRYIFAGPATDKAQQYRLGYTHIVNQNLLFDLRAAFTRINNLSLPLNYGTNPDTTLGFPTNMNFNALSSFLTPIGIGPFSDLGDGAYVPLQDIDNTYQYAGTVSYTLGNHSLKAGVGFIRRQARNVQSAFAAGQYSFGLNTDQVSVGPTAPTQQAATQQTQDNQIASTLVGAFSAASRNYDLNPPDYRSYEPSFFLQDSWRASPKLTVLLGVRYDVFTPFTEAHNRISNFDFTEALTQTAATVSSALKVAGVGGVNSNAGIKTDYSNFAPRLGFAYSVSPKMVVRGGYGLSFFPGNYTSNADLKNAPFVSVYSPNCQSSLAVQLEGLQSAGQNPDCATKPGANLTTDPTPPGGISTAFNQGLPVPSAQTLSSQGLSFVAEDPKFRSALIQQFNLQFEEQFGPNVLTVGYVGNIGQHLPEETNDINSPAPFNPNTGGSSARPLATALPNLGTVNWLQSEGVSNYNALQMSFQRRFSKGLAFDGNYTWGKALSDITGFSEEGQQGWSNADPRHIRQIEYGIAENNIAHRFALSLNYEVQYGKNFTGIKKGVLSGWQVNTITVWQSGKPFSIINSGGSNGPVSDVTTTNGQKEAFGNRATPQNNGGNDRPNKVGNAKNPKKLSEYFNVLNYAPQPVGTIGSAARNSEFGPHFRHIDLSLFKDFPITDGVKLQFRAEAFDITNTPNYYINNNGGNGSTQLGNSAFGTVAQTDPNYVPRELQFALKLQF